MQPQEEGDLFSLEPALDRRRTEKALDELFHEAGAYRRSADYHELLQFVRRFPTLAPYNGFLLHVQKPGTQYVASVSQWKRRFNRSIKLGARPLVILVPFGPVAFVYDLPDTEGSDLFPKELLNPFQTEGGVEAGIYSQVLSNLRRDSVYFAEVDSSCTLAGFIRLAADTRVLKVGTGPVRALYELLVNGNLDIGAKYATLVHELGHLFCGHLGSPDESWWPDRRDRNKNEREFEAESVTWLVCERIGVKNPSAKYLAGYLEQNKEIPSISLDAV
jgi:hypothetical protein